MWSAPLSPPQPLLILSSSAFTKLDLHSLLLLLESAKLSFYLNSSPFTLSGILSS